MKPTIFFDDISDRWVLMYIKSNGKNLVGRVTYLEYFSNAIHHLHMLYDWGDIAR